jgi:hypothetical protein
MWVTDSYDVANNPVLWGTGNPVPMYNPFYRPGDNLYTNSLIFWNPDIGKMNWYHQYVPGDCTGSTSCMRSSSDARDALDHPGTDPDQALTDRLELGLGQMAAATHRDCFQV